MESSARGCISRWKDQISQQTIIVSQHVVWEDTRKQKSEADPWITNYLQVCLWFLHLLRPRSHGATCFSFFFLAKWSCPNCALASNFFGRKCLWTHYRDWVNLTFQVIFGSNPLPNKDFTMIQTKDHDTCGPVPNKHANWKLQQGTTQCL